MNSPETELLDTEEKYVNNLKFIIESFLEPLEKWIEELKQLYDSQENKEKGILYNIIKKEKIDIISVIFSNIRQLLSCNEYILHQLQAGSSNRSTIVSNFSKVAPTLKFYGDYIRNVENSRELLKRLEGDPRLIYLYIYLSHFHSLFIY